ncbi:hypothetical protein LWI29_033981 [Acer saccharum]|uniref:C-JID domain-containing protein n=1 Tax=Acer saccharum TaxID=4024 RepID=A0AA39W173_ACESA|nr:hypothetical protein LWI29_033981 [Acer saccharum]
MNGKEDINNKATKRVSCVSFSEFLDQKLHKTSVLPTTVQVYVGESPPASICYPENDIPKWFSFRSTGSFIDVKLPPHWFNYNFICLALSVVVTISDLDHRCDHQGSCYYRYSNVNYEGIVKSKDGDYCLDRIDVLGNPLSFSLFEVPYCGPDYIRSNHVIIGFGYRFFRQLCDDEFSFRFYVKNRNESNIEHIKVEKCGVHLIFGLHLETSGDDDEFSSRDDDEFMTSSHLEMIRMMMSSPLEMMMSSL